jgi:acyl-coenzyme A synthetase/AMP-(fatty) acid ligase
VCEITHENAVQAMLAFSILFSPRWNENSRWLQFASFHFDVSVLEQYWSWSEGIRVVSAPRDLIFEDLAGTIRALGITHIDLTPSLASLLHPDDVPSLCEGIFITGGEQLKQEILDLWGPKGVIYNGYGPTEATIGVTMFTGVPENGKPSNMGRQFDNVGTYVLQPNTTIPVLRGGVGELCVAGKLVSRGYLNRTDLTKEKFPFLDFYQERIYRTGDLVRLLWDGSFIFLGRADDQVKLRGQRLEIGEINTTIRHEVSDISDIATYVLKHPKQQRDQLVSFFVVGNSENRSRETQISQSEEVISIVGNALSACRARLPTYMVPTHFIPLTTMPLSANNKTDGNVLKKLFSETSTNLLQTLSGANHMQSKLSPTEKGIVSALTNIISVTSEDIRSHSNIFELGLDSITVIRFARALKNSGFSRAQPSTIMTREYRWDK